MICVVGHIVVGTSKTASGFIAGMAISGFGAANCQMAAFALSELLPNKWRHIGVVLADSSTVIAVVVAPVSARFGIEFGTWRWNFYVAAILQFLSFLGLLLLYFPPAHPLGLPFKTVIKELDYLGMAFLSVASLCYQQIADLVSRHVSLHRWCDSHISWDRLHNSIPW